MIFLVVVQKQRICILYRFLRDVRLILFMVVQSLDVHSAIHHVSAFRETTEYLLETLVVSVMQE